MLERDGLVVRFGDREQAYVRDELENLVLAYAVTVHKSQGCEYPVVILPLRPSTMLCWLAILFTRPYPGPRR